MKNQTKDLLKMKHLLANTLTIIITLSIVLSSATLCPAQQQETTNGTAAETALALEKFLSAGKTDNFEYLAKDRPDPFFPFLTQEIMRAEATEREKLTGMQKFEPGQLVLVAIVFAETGTVAMVQDSAGTGYILRKGTKIGAKGQVVDIVANKVIINEQSVSLAQQKQSRTIEMILKKEGEK
ncbi:MAG: hypothetical protein OEY01_16540 [Desulfobulbaceae bacterium]|nr:hypothetical protein [Desulfobulbaceae bacterium]